MSELRANTITASDGTSPVTLTKQEALKSWCLWEQDSTQAITESLNVSSISDTGTGFTLQTFVNSFSSANYSPTYNGVHDQGLYVGWGCTSHDTPPTSSATQVEYLDYLGASKDVEFASSHFVGDLA